jgi:hypothetical protein
MLCQLYASVRFHCHAYNAALSSAAGLTVRMLCGFVLHLTVTQLQEFLEGETQPFVSELVTAFNSGEFSAAEENSADAVAGA